MKAKQASSSVWYNRKGGALALVIAGLMLAYALALRAIDTGSLQQYFLVIVLVIVVANRSLHVMFGHRRATKDQEK